MTLERSAAAAARATEAGARAPLLMAASAVAFGLMAVTLRLAVEQVSAFEAAFFRSLFGLVFSLPLLYAPGLQLLRTRNFHLYLMRGLFGALAMLTSFWAIAHLPLAQAVSIGYSTPLFVTVGAVLLLGEVVRVRRWVAVVAGFAGVLIIMRPGASGFSLATLVAVASAALSAGSYISIKFLSRSEPADAVVIYMNIIIVPFALVPALWAWSWPDASGWLWLVLTGLLGTLGQVLMTRAYQAGDGRQGAFVQIYGNYDQYCDDVPVDTTATVAPGNSGDSVLEIKGNKPVHVVLNHFVLTGASDVVNGGGINFHGTGYLDLSNIDIAGNHAQNGGGIYADGAVPGLTVVLHAGTTVEDNSASADGGGIEAHGETFLYATENPLYVVDNTAGDHGGGIAFDGRGGMTLAAIQIYNNTAAYGGGINANGAGGHLEADLGAGTLIINNTATHDGGGLQVEGDTHAAMLAPQSTVYFNHAFAHGGGWQVVGPANVDIASPGWGAIAAVSGNDAQEGGGISAWVQGDGFLAVKLFSTDAQHPLRIEDNAASDRGGGIFANAWTSNVDVLHDFQYPQIWAWNVHVDGNVAPDGPAIWLDNSQNVFNTQVGAELRFDKTGLAQNLDPAIAALVADCVPDAPCNTIDRNKAKDAAQNPTGGAVLHALPSSEFFADRLAMRGNGGGQLLLTDFNSFGTLNTSLTNCLLAGNTASGNLIVGHDLWLRNCTIADNAIGGSYLLSTDGSILVHRDLLWQPGTTASLQGGDFLDVITSDPQLVAAGTHVVVTDDPRFVAPDQGDYHLLPASPAVDFTDCCSGVDLDGRNRGVAIYDAATRFDIGAYELLRVSGPCLEPDRIFCTGFDQ